jgi:hypothetical protein
LCKNTVALDNIFGQMDISCERDGTAWFWLGCPCIISLPILGFSGAGRLSHQSALALRPQGGFFCAFASPVKGKRFPTRTPNRIAKTVFVLILTFYLLVF